MQFFSAIKKSQKYVGVKNISGSYVLLTENDMKHVIVIGNDVDIIRLPHTTFTFPGDLIAFTFPTVLAAETGRVFALLPHFGQMIDDDTTAAIQRALFVDNVVLASDPDNGKFQVLEGSLTTLSGELSSSSEVLTSSSSSSSSSTVCSDTSSSTITSSSTFVSQSTE